MVLTRQQQLYTYLSGIFVAALLLGDLTGGKAFGVDVQLFGLHYRQPVSVGLFAFPITFLLTDIVNEFYGTKGARFLTMLGCGWRCSASWCSTSPSCHRPTPTAFSPTPSSARSSAWAPSCSWPRSSPTCAGSSWTSRSSP